MSKTIDVINSYYNLLEYDISPEKQEYYGCTISLDDLRSKHDIVCTDRNCSDFKDATEVNIGDVVYIEDEDGDLNSVKIR